MRENRFRVWNKNTKQMEYPTDNALRDYFLRSTGEVFENNDIELVESKHLIALLSTNLKDKNGKEVYEGDMVRFSEYYIGDSLLPESVEEIIYEINGFNDNLMIGYMDCPQWCEVIGNIYENPELIIL